MPANVFEHSSGLYSWDMGVQTHLLPAGETERIYSWEPVSEFNLSR